MFELIRSPRAEADFKAIWRYTVSTWSLAQADRYIEQLWPGPSTWVLMLAGSFTANVAAGYASLVPS